MVTALIMGGAIRPRPPNVKVLAGFLVNGPSNRPPDPLDDLRDDVAKQ
jgi:hypothetical protein